LVSRNGSRLLARPRIFAWNRSNSISTTIKISGYTGLQKVQYLGKVRGQTFLFHIILLRSDREQIGTSYLCKTDCRRLNLTSRSKTFRTIHNYFINNTWYFTQKPSRRSWKKFGICGSYLDNINHKRVPKNSRKS